ncbi:MAG: glycosyltransferase [Bryobacteraceae bacterium]|nr:glycosyltransferase [Bryobacteraceae bacterium]
MMNLIEEPLALLLAAPSAKDEFVRSLFDSSFSGIHSLEWFDYALLVPYFTVMAILSIYGLHRFETILSHYKGRKNIPQQPARRFAELPPVTIQLPLYNERYVVDQLLDAVSKIEYPREKLQIQVLDDSTDDTHPYTEALAARYRDAGFPIEYRHRSNRHGFKAGALQEGMESATGELIAVFDADFLPPSDFLLKTVDYFADPEVGVVQTRWSYTNRHYNLLTEVEAMLLDGHFVLEHVARAGNGWYFNFNGTAGILRRRMIEDAGGWEHDTLTEDSDLSYRAQLKGWRFVYLPDIHCPSELPVETYGFQVQQSRWAKGLMQVARKILPRILKSDIPLRSKIEAVFHLTPNISYPLMVILSALMLPVMIIRFYMGWWQMLVVDLPIMIASFWSIGAFYLTAHRQLYPRSWWRGIFLMPALICAGVGLTIINARAVLEAIFGVQTAFARTPKYAVAGQQKMKLANVKYRRRSGWLPYLELAFGTYFLFIIAYAIDSANYFAAPFLMPFVGGYYWAGISTLWQEHQGRMRWQREQDAAARQAEAAVR